MLDVGTSNALVLYNEGKKLSAGENASAPMNIVKFKMHLVEHLAAKRVDPLAAEDSGEDDEEESKEHVPVHITFGSRYRCAFCALEGKFRRTRFMCAACGVAMCSVGSGRVTRDCFTLSHRTEEQRRLVCEKFQEMQKFATKPE